MNVYIYLFNINKLFVFFFIFYSVLEIIYIIITASNNENWFK